MEWFSRKDKYAKWVDKETQKSTKKEKQVVDPRQQLRRWRLGLVGLVVAGVAIVGMATFLVVGGITLYVRWPSGSEVIAWHFAERERARALAIAAAGGAIVTDDDALADADDEPEADVPAAPPAAPPAVDEIEPPPAVEPDEIEPPPAVDEIEPPPAVEPEEMGEPALADEDESDDDEEEVVIARNPLLWFDVREGTDWAKDRRQQILVEELQAELDEAELVRIKAERDAKLAKREAQKLANAEREAKAQAERAAAKAESEATKAESERAERMRVAEAEAERLKAEAEAAEQATLELQRQAQADVTERERLKAESERLEAEREAEQLELEQARALAELTESDRLEQAIVAEEQLERAELAKRLAEARRQAAEVQAKLEQSRREIAEAETRIAEHNRRRDQILAEAERRGRELQRPTAAERQTELAELNTRLEQARVDTLRANLQVASTQSGGRSMVVVNGYQWAIHGVELGENGPVFADGARAGQPVPSSCFDNTSRGVQEATGACPRRNALYQVTDL